MVSRFHSRVSVTQRTIAIFGALLILASQAIGVAHFHESAGSRNRTAVAQLTVDEALCPLCQFALHSPGSVSSTPTVACVPVIFERLLLAASVAPESPVLSTARVRAPPVAL
jgi:hypothetical protein